MTTSSGRIDWPSRTVAAVLVATLVGGGAGAQDAVHRVAIVNGSGLVLVSLHAFPVDAAGDGPDLLANGPLAAGAQVRLEIRPSAGCQYRLRAVLAGGLSRNIAGIDLCARTSLRLLPFGDGPAFGNATAYVAHRHSYHRAPPVAVPTTATVIPPPPPPPPSPVETGADKATPPQPTPIRLPPGPSASLPPAATPFCPAIGDVATAAECDRVTQIKANLATGTGAFNAPAEMQRRQTVRLRLAIDREAKSAAAAEAVAPLGGTTVTFPTKVGRFMRAELSGEGFTVKPLTPAGQDLYAADQAQWEWQVTANDAGDRVLTLKAVVEIEGVDGKPHPAGNIVTENRTIHVVVPADQSWSDRIDAAIAWTGKGTNLLKALAGLLGAALALWLAIRKFRPAQP